MSVYVASSTGLRGDAGSNPAAAPCGDGLTGKAPRLFLSLLLAALACAAPLTGCGASALRTHATIGSVAAVTLGHAAPLVAPACDVALTQCRGEVACVTETAERCRVATGAVEGLVLVTRGYLDAIEVASMADEGEVMPALLTGLSRLVVRWAEVVALLGRFGVALPALPALASSLLGGGS